MSCSALQRAALEADRARLEALQHDVTRREADLTRLKRDLMALQSRYLDEMGGLYAQLNELDEAIAEIEIATGLRPPPDPDDDGDEGDGPEKDAVGAASNCTHRGEPSVDLKRIFRQLAKSVHPDLARDGATHYRRHSLMAEANRAYAERDEDRLRLLLSKWQQQPEAFAGGDSESEQGRLQRRITALEDRLHAMDAEMTDLRTSAIWRLSVKIEDARKQGWDLFAEMGREVQRETQRATARLAKLKRARPV
jgi:hypothetical protein